MNILGFRFNLFLIKIIQNDMLNFNIWLRRIFDNNFQTNFGSLVWMNWLAMSPMTTKVSVIFRGSEPWISATYGASIVITRAAMLPSPNTVVANTVGMRFIKLMKVNVKPAVIPNLATPTWNGIAVDGFWLPYREIRPRIPHTETEKAIWKLLLGPRWVYKKPAAMDEVISAIYDDRIFTRRFPSAFFKLKLNV